jgi:hypothetical protein
MHDLLIDLHRQDPHLKNGYYTCGGKMYLNKIEALVDATQKNSDVEYYYNDHVYQTYPWSLEPQTSLCELYRSQCQKFRDQYDHLIVMFSGGSDSTNILKSFIDNRIYPDEIWSFVADSHVIDRYSRTNIEITVTAQPELKQAEKLGIKVKLINLLEFDTELDDDWFFDAPTMRMSPDNIMRKNVFFKNPDIIQRVDQGQKVGIIFGYDKPRILLDNDTWKIGFLDTFSAASWKSRHKFSAGPFIEFFYYDPDIPEVLCKSAHMLIDHFENIWSDQQCQNFFNYLDCRKGPIDTEVYYRHVNQILYPTTWEPEKFSLGKAKGRFNQIFCQKTDFLLDRMSHWDNSRKWMQGIERIQKILDPKFYKPWVQINGHWSLLYPIRRLQSRIK